MNPTFFKSSEALRAWFAEYAAKRTELWIGYYKKASGKEGLGYKQALDEALCVGWIDGQVKSIDEISYMQRWTPRTAKSVWSNVNVKRMEELIAEGRALPSGIATFERKTADRTGIYSFEQPPVELSADFLKRFKANKEAFAFFQAQPPGYKRSAQFHVMSAKREDTREKRLGLLIDHSERSERLLLPGMIPKKKPPSKAASSTTTESSSASGSSGNKTRSRRRKDSD